MLSKVQTDFRLLITGMGVALVAHVRKLVQEKHLIYLFLKRVLQMYGGFVISYGIFHRKWK